MTKILRSCEKMYYDKILEQQKKNVKGTWNILNKIIGKKKSNHSYPDIFTHLFKKKIFIFCAAPPEFITGPILTILGLKCPLKNGP